VPVLHDEAPADEEQQRPKNRKLAKPGDFIIAEDNVADEKISQILWDVDMAEFNLPAQDPQEESTDWPQGEIGENNDSIVVSVRDEDGGLVLEEEEGIPIMQHGSRVEYYSKTHKRWMMGTLEVKQLPGTLLKDPEITYSVNVHTGGTKMQRRENVTPDTFRAPLAQGDRVEVFSRSRGEWLTGLLEGMQHNPGLNGYRVQMDDDTMSGEGKDGGRIFEKVPANRVRRHFDVGSVVSCYRGPVEGWQVGFVESTPEGSETMLEQFGPALEGRSKSTSSFQTLAEAEEGAVQDGPNSPQPWSFVAFKEVDKEAVQFVPSYLVYVMAEV